MLDGSVSGFHSWGCFKPSSQPNLSSVSICWREQFWQTDFQLTEGKRESLEWLEALSWERGDWKQMSETLPAKTACECVSSSCTVLTGWWYILKVQLLLTAPTSSVTTIYLGFSFSFPLPFTMTDRGLRKKWKCSEMQEFLQNRKSPPLKCRTMQ